MIVSWWVDGPDKKRVPISAETARRAAEIWATVYWPKESPQRVDLAVFDLMGFRRLFRVFAPDGKTPGFKVHPRFGR